ncbi:hypothetical protein ABZ621_37100 [Streptomyces sp. NPDC007863]|uniref:hypothetical protein n=1 Tax=unclassified Streptomyces TaxID=2593676 RepID=UPI00340EBF89
MRELARAMGPGVVSSSRIHDAFTKPRLPTWGLVALLVTELGSRTPGADAAVELKRFHALWDAAAEADTLPQATDEPGRVQEVAPAIHQAATVMDVPESGKSVPSTLLLADIERFSSRDGVEQGYMRRMLSDLLDRVAEAAGIDPAARRRMDQGDAVIERIDVAVPMVNLLRTVLTVLPMELRTVNRLASDAVQLRPRLVLATGNLSMDGHGWAGVALNDAFRLLDAGAVRAALHGRTDNYVLCVSEAVYWTTVSQNHPGISVAEFHEIGVQTKNGSMRAWLHQPPA